jgi:Mor family transcriptional regulator
MVMDSSRLPRSRIAVEELIALFGERVTKRLILHCAGRRVPSREQYLKAIRRMMVVDDWLNRGYSQRDLAAKYELSLPYVKRLITQYLNRRRPQAARHAD